MPQYKGNQNAKKPEGTTKAAKLILRCHASVKNACVSQAQRSGTNLTDWTTKQLIDSLDDDIKEKYKISEL
jgi:hypothetical protein